MLAQHSDNTLEWYERYERLGQFTSAIDFAALTDDVKLTYLKTLVTGKAKTAFAELCTMYEDALKALEYKSGRRQINSTAFLDKLNSFPPVEMHNSDHIFNVGATISSLVGLFPSLN